MNESDDKISNQRRRYSPEFKDRALLQAESEGIPRVAKDLGLSESVLYAWRAKQRSTGRPHEIQKQQQAEMTRLKRELARLKQENAFLKKAATYFAKEQEQGTE